VVPEAWRIIRTGESNSIGRIGTGFGNYTLEAFLLLALAGGAALLTRPRQPAQARVGRQRAIGLAFVTLAAVLAAWRLASMSAA
jgi:hypothetical protein